MEENIAAITNFITSILSEGFIIIAISYSIGEFIKRSSLSWVKKIHKDYIPIIVGCVGMALSLIPEIFPSDSIRIGLLKGFICGIASTGVFEGYKNTKKTIKAKQEERKTEIKEEILEELKGNEE